MMHYYQIRSDQISRSVVSDSLRPHESQHARPPCLSPTPGVHSDSCPSSQWCHPAISSSVVPFSSCPPIPPSIRVFSNESTLPMQWPKYWNFSFSIIPSKEIPVLWPPHAKNWIIGKDSDAGRDWGQEEKGTTEDEMAGRHHQLDGLGFGWTAWVGDGQGGLACCDSWGRKESDTT